MYNYLYTQIKIVSTIKKEINVHNLIVGPIQTNCYIVSAPNKSCFIIDPGYDSNKIIDYINSEKLSPNSIICTHGHADHIGAVKELMDIYSISAYLNPSI